MSEKPSLNLVVAELLVTALQLQKKDFLDRGKIRTPRHGLEKIIEVLEPYQITKRRGGAAAKPKKASAMSDEEWFAMLEKSPAYEGIDVRREFEKCKVWATTKGLGQVSRRRLVNWLNKAVSEKPISANGRRVRVDVNTEPDGWRDVLRRIGAMLKWDRERLDEICRQEWHETPLTVRQEVVKAIEKGL